MDAIWFLFGVALGFGAGVSVMKVLGNIQKEYESEGDF